VQWIITSLHLAVKFIKNCILLILFYLVQYNKYIICKRGVGISKNFSHGITKKKFIIIGHTEQLLFGQMRYLKHQERLVKQHKMFKKMKEILGPMQYSLPKWDNLNDAVLYAVIGQMLSVKAANSIINNLRSNLSSADDILKWASKNKSKSGPIYGVSRSKRRALAMWNNFYSANRKDIRKWHKQSSSEVKEKIVSIWCFGLWAADMILIFHLGKMDVWPETDGGIKRGVEILFPEKSLQEVKSYVAGAETIAALYIWQMLNEKVEHHFV